MPQAPDPTTTAAAQTASNKSTALYNFGLSNPNVNTPLGSMSYSVANTSPTYDTDAYNKAMQAWQAQPQSSQQWINDPRYTGGGYYKTTPGAQGAMPTLDQFKTGDGGNPQVTQQISLSPEQQQLYSQGVQQQIGLSDLANTLQNGVGQSLSQPQTTPADINALSKQAQDAYYAQQTAYLDPQFATQQSQLDSQLANQGIMPGSQAYQTAEDQQNRDKTFAYNQAQQNAITAGPQNAQALFGLSTAARDQPLNEFNALRSQSQVSMPSFQPTTASAAQPTNVMQAYQNQYAGQQNAYNQQVAGNNATTSGLFGLGGTALSGLGQGMGSAGGLAAFFSDARLKENITRLGSEKGFPIYSFAYKNDPEHRVYRGVMAQDVLRTRPDAVVTDGEYMAVDYGKLGIQFGRLH